MQTVAHILDNVPEDYLTLKCPQVVSSDIDLLSSASWEEHGHQPICTWFDGTASETKHEANQLD